MFDFSRPLSVGKIQLKNRVILAPLAGITDAPFRRVCATMGAGLTWVEMVSAVAITYRNRKTFEMLDKHESEGLVGAQLAGASVEALRSAAHEIQQLGYPFLDLNMGCPVRKLVANGCGAALLKTPDLISTILDQLRSEFSGVLSAKFRIGYTREDITVVDTVRRVIESGVDIFTVHGRTRSEGYSSPIDYATLAQGFAFGRGLLAEKYPERQVAMVGNGGVFCHKTAQKMAKETGCDAVMVSRGALGNPWIFREILTNQVVVPTLQEWHEMILLHIKLQRERYGDTHSAAIGMRKHLLWYAKGFPHVRQLRPRLGLVESLTEAEAILSSYVATLPKDLLRFCHEDGASVDEGCLLSQDV